jgi:UDP-glucose 4-epimerase
VDDYCSVKQSISWITDELGVQPEVVYGHGNKGWVGDNPFIWLDVSKAELHGWKATSSIEESVRATVRWLKQNPKKVSDK